jgi:hypothetical protein
MHPTSPTFLKDLFGKIKSEEIGAKSPENDKWSIHKLSNGKYMMEHGGLYLSKDKDSSGFLITTKTYAKSNEFTITEEIDGSGYSLKTTDDEYVTVGNDGLTTKPTVGPKSKLQFFSFNKIDGPLNTNHVLEDVMLYNKASKTVSVYDTEKHDYKAEPLAPALSKLKDESGSGSIDTFDLQTDIDGYSDFYDLDEKKYASASAEKGKIETNSEKGAKETFNLTYDAESLIYTIKDKDGDYLSQDASSNSIIMQKTLNELVKFELYTVHKIQILK